MANSGSRSPGAPGDTSDIPAQRRPKSRRVIRATCTTHGGPRGFTNLVMRKLDGRIELDAHGTGACVLQLDEAEAAEVRDQLGEWLGR